MVCLIVGAAAGAAEQAIEQTEPSTAESAAVDMVITQKSRPPDVVYGEIVNRVYAPRIHDWVMIDRGHLILYVTRSKPYLVTLRRKSHSLTPTSIIGLERNNNSIDARFDQIYVDGFPYPIKRIEKLSIDTAKRLRGIEIDPVAVED